MTSFAVIRDMQIYPADAGQFVRAAFEAANRFLHSIGHKLLTLAELQHPQVGQQKIRSSTNTANTTFTLAPLWTAQSCAP